MKTNEYDPLIARPKTRGELKRRLQQGEACEVVSSNVEITTILLKGWLDFDRFTTRPSGNVGWTVFEPNLRTH
jgi:hypothetical protein